MAGKSGEILGLEASVYLDELLSQGLIYCDPSREEDVQADDVIRFKNLPPNVPTKDFWSMLAVADSAGSSNKLDLRAAGFF